uniref:Laccase-1 n=1 Tax=Anthurium amnicola TaxID=1678845 RepID=A0A1D1YLK9_9ARAE
MKAETIPSKPFLFSPLSYTTREQPLQVNLLPLFILLDGSTPRENSDNNLKCTHRERERKRMMVMVMMAMMSSVLDAKEVGAGAGGGEAIPVVEKLREALMSTLGGGLRGMPPRDPDWLVPLGFILVALFALACVMAYIIARWNSWKERPAGVPMFEHECLVASLAMVLLIVLSLASLYYYFCFRGGCYGAAFAKAGSAAAGRKAKMMMMMNR